MWSLWLILFFNFIQSAGQLCLFEAQLAEFDSFWRICIAFPIVFLILTSGFSCTLQPKVISRSRDTQEFGQFFGQSTFILWICSLDRFHARTLADRHGPRQKSLSALLPLSTLLCLYFWSSFFFLRPFIITHPHFHGNHFIDTVFVINDFLVVVFSEDCPIHPYWKRSSHFFRPLANDELFDLTSRKWVDSRRRSLPSSFLRHWFPEWGIFLFFFLFILLFTLVCVFCSKKFITLFPSTPKSVWFSSFFP